MQETRSTCPYCGVGCGVVIEHDGARVHAVRGDPDHPANRGLLCSKGRALHLTMQPAAMTGRLTSPLRRAHRDAPLRPASWSSTLDDLATRFADCIARHGPDSVAFYLSGQLLTEDYYVFNKLAKGLIGTNNVDTNSRLCMSSAVAAYKRTLGADAPPACYEDIDHARCILLAGSNAAWTHPVLFRRIEAARQANPELRLIVVDPRTTATASTADLHLAIEPGTDVALFHGMLHWLLWEERIDREFIAEHTAGFDALRSFVREFSPRTAAAICGIGEEQLVQAARWFADGPTLSMYCQGLNQSTSGTANNAALINLHLATGQIGRPGAGPFSLTGQPNAMGGREVGGLANLLPGHRDVTNPRDRAEMEGFWRGTRISARPGHAAVELFDALRTSDVRMVWIACTNPAQSMPNQAAVREALRRAELVVLQEAYADTETAEFADVLLPAASWAEKEGTVTNSERRISRVRTAVPAPGDATADWCVARDFGRRLEARLRPGSPSLFPWENAASVYDEYVRTTAGRDLDASGLSHAVLDRVGPQQWPCPAGAVSGRARLYGDGVFPTADGRARFAAVPFTTAAEAIDARYPFRLNTGRLRDQWHGMTRTGAIAASFAHAPEPVLEMHPADLARRQIESGELVRVESRRGALVVPVVASESVKAGAVYLPMHWGSAVLAGADSFGANALTNDARCPESRQPELKHAAVRIARADLPWQIVAFAVGEACADLHALRIRARALVRDFAYASVVPAAGEHAGIWLHAAAREPAEATILAALDSLLGIAGTDLLRYDDPRRQVTRRIRVQHGRIVAARLAGDVAGGEWLRDWATAGRSIEGLRARVVVPCAAPPNGTAPSSRIVCQCVGITEGAIRRALDECRPETAPLPHLQSTLGCGTQCGSCVPELKQMVSSAHEAATTTEALG